jgi:ribonuclease BN (tRNA processing enzyme)
MWKMKITILGTGTFFVGADRSGPAYLLESDGKKILIDCGPGTLMRLSEIGVKPEDLDYVFITHFHADHTSDLFALQMNIRLTDFFIGKLKKKLIIYGPAGIENFTKKLSKIYQLPAFDNYEKIEYIRMTKEISLGLLSIKSFKVDHIALGKAATSIALRFEENGKSFVFSGDSNKNNGLLNACNNADLFICDTSFAKGKGSIAHLDTYEIGEICEKSKVKKVILSHFYPLNDGIDLVAEVKEKYRGKVVCGKDLMEIIL